MTPEELKEFDTLIAAFHAVWDQLSPGTKLYHNGDILVRMAENHSHYIWSENLFSLNAGLIHHYSEFFISSDPSGLEKLKKAIETPT